jgi:hypothetical protein
MSAASEPAPRAKKPGEIKSSSSRHNFFWPILIYLIGAGSLALYQVLAMEDQYETLTQSVDQMDGKVKRAQYEKAKFFRIAGELLQIAPKDANANQIVDHYKLRVLQQQQPDLMYANTPSDMAQINLAAQAAAETNAAPLNGSLPTNAAPQNGNPPTNAVPLNGSFPTNAATSAVSSPGEK